MQPPYPLAPSPLVPLPFPAQVLQQVSGFGGAPFTQPLAATIPAATTTFAGLATGISSPESTRQNTLNFPLSISQLRIATSTAQPAGQNLTVNVRRNGVSVGIQVVISASAPAGVYQSSVAIPVQYAPGDSFSIQLIQDAGASASASIISWTVS